MRVARVGLQFAIGGALLVVAAGGAPAATASQTPPSFKVTISPEYTTAGQPTTFQVTVVDTSTSGAGLGSVNLTPPAGFTPPQPLPGTPLRHKSHLHNRTLSLHSLELMPGHQAQLSISTTAPTTCGRTHLHWASHGFETATGAGPQLTLDAALSSVGVSVLCPSTAACGDGGPPCSTSLVTSNSTYAVISDASSGTLRQTVNVGNRLACGSYRFRDPNWYDSGVAAASPPASGVAPAPIVDHVTYRIRDATARGIGFCLGVAYDFATASGGQAPAGTLPNGNPGFIGLLPRCSKAAAPCIASISQPKDPSARIGFDALMTILIPETGDPWGAG